MDELQFDLDRALRDAYDRGVVEGMLKVCDAVTDSLSGGARDNDTTAQFIARIVVTMRRVRTEWELREERDNHANL